MNAFRKVSIASVFIVCVFVASGCLPGPTPTYTITATAGENGSITPSGEISLREGSDQAFTITPDSGYEIADVRVDGVSVGAVEEYIFVNVMKDRGIHATFSEIQVTYTITASVGAGGSISPSGTVVVEEGDNQAFTITPDTGYEIDDVEVDGVSVGEVEAYTFEDVTDNHTINVTFTEIVTRTITATAGEGGSIDPEGEVSVTHGEHQKFTITPNAGFKIDDVEVDGVSVGAGPTYTFVNVTKDHEIHATFSEIIQYTITATSGANGKILPSGSVPVNEGDDQRFFMDPNPGYAVYDVLVDKDSVGAVEEYTFENITQDHEIHVTFIKTYTITATAGAGGSISPSGTVTVIEGDDQKFTITPNTGYEIDDVLMDGVSVGAVEEYTFENVNDNHTIHAAFTEQTND